MITDFERDTKAELADLIDVRLHHLMDYTDGCEEHAEQFTMEQLQIVANWLDAALNGCEEADIPVIPEGGDL